MKKADILAKIASYQKVVDSTDPAIADFEREIAQEEIDDLRGQLAKLDDEPAPQPARRRGRQPRAAKTKKDGTPRKPKAGHQMLQPGDTTKDGMLIMDAEGRVLDNQGTPLAEGDTVEVSNSKGSWVGTIMALARHRGGGHNVKFMDNSTVKTQMFQPANTRKVDADTLEIDQKIPAKLIDNATVVDRQDCDDNQVVLVKPTEAVVVNAPTVADPDKGDKIMVNKQGHPIAVVHADAQADDYEPAGKAKVKTGKKGQVAAIELDETAERQADATERPDKAIKAQKPPADCGFLDEAEDMPVLQTFLEGMRQAFREGDSSEYVKRVLIRKSDKRIVLEIKEFGLLGFGKLNYYSVCLESGKLTKTTKPDRENYQTVMGEDAMKEFFRTPNQNTCRRLSKELHVVCYRDGDCTDERKKRLIQLFTTGCRKRQDEQTRAYLKYAHQLALARVDGYTGRKSYAQIFSEVIRELKAGKDKK